MKGTQYLLRAIRAEGVEYLFMLPGGVVDEFYPDLTDGSSVRPIVAAQEGTILYRQSVRWWLKLPLIRARWLWNRIRAS